MYMALRGCNDVTDLENECDDLERGLEQYVKQVDRLELKIKNIGDIK